MNSAEMHDTASQEFPQEEKLSSLSDEDMAQLKLAQKRNMVIALILGLLLMASGFFAGQAMRSHSGISEGGSSISEERLLSLEESPSA